MWRLRWWGEPGKTLDGAGRTPGSGSDQAFPDGVADQTGDVVDVQLLHDARAVKLGGFGGDREQRGDLLGRLAFGHELRDLALTGGQPAPVLRRRGPAVGRRGYHFEGVPLEQGTHALSQHDVIVGQHYS